MSVQETNRDAVTMSDRMREAHLRYDALTARCGMATMDMSHLWSGWLGFGFTGNLSVHDHQLAEDAGLLAQSETSQDASDGDSLGFETAYCSSVFRDMCRDLASACPECPPDDVRYVLPPAIQVFCDAEENGNYKVEIENERVSVWVDDYRNSAEVEACELRRSDGGSYITDLIETIGCLRDSILDKDDQTRNDILGSLALFCERVSCDEDDQIVVEDATPQEVADILSSVGCDKKSYPSGS